MNPRNSHHDDDNGNLYRNAVLGMVAIILLSLATFPAPTPINHRGLHEKHHQQQEQPRPPTMNKDYGNRIHRKALQNDDEFDRIVDWSFQEMETMVDKAATRAWQEMGDDASKDPKLIREKYLGDANTKLWAQVDTKLERIVAKMDVGTSKNDKPSFQAIKQLQMEISSLTQRMGERLTSFRAGGMASSKDLWREMIKDKLELKIAEKKMIEITSNNNQAGKPRPVGRLERIQADPRLRKIFAELEQAAIETGKYDPDDPAQNEVLIDYVMGLDDALRPSLEVAEELKNETVTMGKILKEAKEVDRLREEEKQNADELYARFQRPSNAEDTEEMAEVLTELQASKRHMEMLSEVSEGLLEKAQALDERTEELGKKLKELKES